MLVTVTPAPQEVPAAVPAPESLPHQRNIRHRRKKSKQGIVPSDITFDQIAAQFHLPSEEAAIQLGVSLTVLKRICRKHGIERWPYRKFKSLGRSQAQHSSLPSSPLGRSPRPAGSAHSSVATSSTCDDGSTTPTSAAEASWSMWAQPQQPSTQLSDAVAAVAHARAGGPCTSVPASALTGSAPLPRMASDTTSGIDMLLSAIEREQERGPAAAAEMRDTAATGRLQQAQRPPANMRTQAVEKLVAAVAAAKPAVAAVAATAAVQGQELRPLAAPANVKQRLLASWAQRQRQLAAQAQALPPAQSAPCSPRVPVPPPAPFDVAAQPGAVGVEPSLNPPPLPSLEAALTPAMAAAAAQPAQAAQAAQAAEGEGETVSRAASVSEAQMDRLPTFRGWQGLCEGLARASTPQPALQPTTSDFSFGGQQQSATLDAAARPAAAPVRAATPASPRPPLPPGSPRLSRFEEPYPKQPPSAALASSPATLAGVLSQAQSQAQQVQQQQVQAQQVQAQQVQLQGLKRGMSGQQIVDPLWAAVEQLSKRPRLDPTPGAAAGGADTAPGCTGTAPEGAGTPLNDAMPAAVAAVATPEVAALWALLQQTSGLARLPALTTPSAAAAAASATVAAMAPSAFHRVPPAAPPTQLPPASQPAAQVHQQIQVLRSLVVQQLQQQQQQQVPAASMQQQHHQQLPPQQQVHVQQAQLAQHQAPRPATTAEQALQAALHRHASTTTTPSSSSGAFPRKKDVPVELAERVLAHYAARLGWKINGLQLEKAQ